MRQIHMDALLNSLKEVDPVEFESKAWSRIVDALFNCDPLSAKGSLKIGERFNIGEDVFTDTYLPFPVLYIAENYKVAYVEKFGVLPNETVNGLSGSELALRSPGSFSHFAISGKIERLFNLNNINNLKQFTKIIADFPVPPDLAKLAKEVGQRSNQIIIQDPKILRASLLAPNWKSGIFLTSTPSNSQIFGRLLILAGFDGIQYQSTKGKGNCIALFPEVFKDTDSFIEISDSVNECVENKRLDNTSYQSFY